jgi:biopolymer transport protein ExbD
MPPIDYQLPRQMNLRKNLRPHDEGPHTGTLNDILFILLFFFLIVSTMANPNVVKLSIPRAQSDTKSKQTVVVSIDSMQQFYVGTRAVLKDSLSAAIGTALLKSKQDAEPTVVINADKKADAESVVAVMKAARLQKLRTVLAVAQEQ